MHVGFWPFEVVRALLRRLRPKVSYGGGRRPWPPDEDWPGRGRRRRDDDGGTGVREPRRPKPSPSAAGAAAEPPRQQHLDLTN